MGRGNIKVLIVDDERLIVTTLEMSLEEMGFETTPSASTGEEAIAIATEKRPSVVLMDINLPGKMNGIDAAKAIYSQLNIRSIFISGYPKDEMAAATEGPWCLEYLTKPYSLERLQQAIEAACVAEAS